MYRLFNLIFLVLVSFQIGARPVSYPGGWTAMTMNDGDRYSGYVHYSPTAKYSVGYKAEYWRESDYQIHALQINNLLKRWNRRHSQANFYLKSGIGLVYSDFGSFGGKTEFVLFTGLAADWETRRYFISYENRVTEAGDITDSFRQKARIGIAPYVADYGSLHTWLMIEFRHESESQHEFVIAPLIRLFKGSNLFEAGVSSEGDVLLNYVYRY